MPWYLIIVVVFIGGGLLVPTHGTASRRRWEQREGLRPDPRTPSNHTDHADREVDQ